MATPQEALVSFFLADATVTALLWKDSEGDYAFCPDGSLPIDAGYPRVTFFVVDWPIVEGLSGPTGFCKPRIQFDVRAKGTIGYGQAWALEEAIRNSNGGVGGGPIWSGYHGTIAGVDVRRVRLIDRADYREEPIHGEKFPVRRVRLDFLVECIES